jgi:hypothetical protein
MKKSKSKNKKYKNKTKKGGQPKDLIVGKKYTVCSNNGLFKGTLNKKINNKFIFNDIKDETHLHDAFISSNQFLVNCVVRLRLVVSKFL